MNGKLDSLTVTELLEIHKHVVFLIKEFGKALETDDILELMPKEKVIENIVKYINIGQLITKELFVKRLGIEFNENTI